MADAVDLLNISIGGGVTMTIINSVIQRSVGLGGANQHSDVLTGAEVAECRPASEGRASALARRRRTLRADDLRRNPAIPDRECRIG